MKNSKPHPHDSMPVANGDNKYAPPEKMIELEENPRPEEEIADWFDESDHIEHEKNYASRHESTPEFEKGAAEVVTMHEKMYRIATAKYNPFAIGGSESIHDFQGGSEQCQQ
tara:strand:- start:1890 stop:2225 length:336 start_codon:yes stop_codon:yes gene_type:complete